MAITLLDQRDKEELLEKIEENGGSGGGGGKEPYIVTVTKNSSGISWGTNANWMWEAHEEGREVLISYLGYEYIRPYFIDDAEGKRIHIEWDDKHVENPENLDEVLRHEIIWGVGEGNNLFIERNYPVPRNYELPIVHEQGTSFESVMSQWAVSQELIKLRGRIPTELPSPEPIIIDGEEYDGSVKMEINTVRNWNELEGRPFGEGAADVLTYDGNLAGAEALMMEEGVYLIKLSDYVPDPSALQNFAVTVGETVVPITDFVIDGDATMWSVVPNGAANVTVMGITELPEGIEEMCPGITTGLWGMHIVADGMALYISEAVFAYDGIKPIPVEYLPKSVPYVVEGGEGIVEAWPKTTYEFEEGNTQMDVLIDEAIYNAIVPNETYIVNWNGTEYECVSVDTSVLGFDFSGAVLGNIGALTDGADTGEPFVIGVSFFDTEDEAPYVGMIMSVDGSTSVTLSVSKGQSAKIQKLDNRCLDLEWIPAPKMAEEVVFDEDVRFNASSYSVSATFFPLVEGSKYKVTFDGVEYETVAKARTGDLAGNGNILTQMYIGNLNALESDIVDGEPFCYAYLVELPEETSGWRCRSKKSTTVPIKVIGQIETREPIPQAYLPAGAGGGFYDVTIPYEVINIIMGEATEEGEITIEQAGTYDAVMNGKSIRLVADVDQGGQVVKFILVPTIVGAMNMGDYTMTSAFVIGIDSETFSPKFITITIIG